MAGAIAIGDGLAKHKVVSNSSAMPARKRAIALAVAGAIKIKSAHLANSM